MFCPDANTGHRGGKPVTNRLSYGMAMVSLVSDMGCGSYLRYFFFLEVKFRIRCISTIYLNSLIYRVFIVQAYQVSQYVVLHGGIFLVQYTRC
jgi:hypothetical protein